MHLRMFVAGSLLLALMLPTLPAAADEATTVAQARASLKLHDYDGAIAVLDKEIAAGSSSPEVYSLRCLALGENHRFKDALADCNHAIGLDSKYGDAYRVRGNLYLDAGYPSKSLPDFDTFLAAQADDVDALWSRCDARRLTKDIQGATADCKRASDLAPNSPNIRISLGRLELLANDLDDAYAAFDFAVKANAKDGIAQYWRGHTALEQKNYAQAIADLSAVIAAGDNAPETYSDRARAYLGAGRQAEGKADWEKAVARTREMGDCSGANRLALLETVLFAGTTNITVQVCPK